MQKTLYPTPLVAAPALPADLAALVNTTGAPPADATQRVPPPVTVKPTKRRTSAARRNADMANLRDDMLEVSRAAGSLQAAHLLGVLS